MLVRLQLVRIVQGFFPWVVFCGFLIAQAPTFAHLRILVVGADGQPVPAQIVWTSNGQLSLHTEVDSSPVMVSLPSGRWQAVISSKGFLTRGQEYTVYAGEERAIRIRLRLAPVAVVTTVHAGAAAPGVQTTSVQVVSPRELREVQPAQPGRGVIDLVDAQPGWLLEANSTLHPRGSEYDTQYLLNGIPLLENRSPVFTPPLNLLAVHSLDVQTAGYSAADGRKLGGLIAVSTAQSARPGLHGELRLSIGSFGTIDSDLLLQQQLGSNTVSLSAEGAHTDRYLDPPVIGNFTNRADLRGAALTWTRDSQRDHLLVYLHHATAAALVPNEQVQQSAGQRQDRHLDEQIGQFAWQHLLSSRLIAALHAMLQQQRAQLDSNASATPMWVAADRRRRLAYLSGDLTFDLPRQQFNVGGDLLAASLREQLQSAITDPAYFDPGTPLTLAFFQRHPDRELALWTGDHLAFGPWSVDLGLRWDRYDVLVRDHGWSPRLGLAWRLPWNATTLHASWDHTFETPASENLLLASSPLAWSVTHATTGLVLRPSRGNFYQVGLEQPLGPHATLQANWFLRSSENFFDDDLLLDTGISFPISFAGARIQGTEVGLTVPAWGRFSGFASWSNQVGTAWDPITGGLFLDPDAASQLQAHDRFPVSQDQRNTLRARLRAGLTGEWWTALEYQYGSGLPTDTSHNPADLVSAYGAAVVSQVNFVRGRLYPNHTVDASVGGSLWHHGDRTLSLEVSALNLTNHLNVINFAGLFSGTAIAPPRNYHVNLSMNF